MATDKFKFTLARLKNLPVTGERYIVRDTENPYLQCRVSATGKHTLQIQRRAKGQTKPIRVKLQNTGSMNLIRAEADAINALLSSGINPNEKKKTEEALEITLQSAFNKYKKGKSLAASTIKSYETALSKMQSWKDKPMKNISKQMVLDLYNDLAQDSHSAAMKMAQVVRAVWNFTNDLTDDDAFGRPPTIILNKQKKKWSRSSTRNRKITINDLPDWIEAVRGLPTNKFGEGTRMAAYLEFLLLTGLRRREAGHLLWKDVNFKDGYFIIKNTKNRSDHCLPITKRTGQLLNIMKGNGEQVFGVEEPKKAIKRVTEACGVVFSCHDLRRTFATLADYSGAGGYAVKGILNHASNDVTGSHYAAYRPLDSSGNVNLDEVKAMKESLQKIESFILTKAKANDKFLRIVK